LRYVLAVVAALPALNLPARYEVVVVEPWRSAVSTIL
jgi:hypothetical protein